MAPQPRRRSSDKAISVSNIVVALLMTVVGAAIPVVFKLQGQAESMPGQRNRELDQMHGDIDGLRQEIRELRNRCRES